MNLHRFIPIQCMFSRAIHHRKFINTSNVVKLVTERSIPLQICSCRYVSTLQSKRTTTKNERGYFAKLLEKIPIFNLHNTRVKVAAYLLYEEIADKINYVEFFNLLELPDTFYSWFVVTELHIWMLSVRAMAEGPDGRRLRNDLVEALWADVEQRVKKIGASNPSDMRLRVKELSEQLQAALLAYDEGLQSSDMVLAGAIWRRMYQKNYVDPENLEILVKYIRKQITLLDNLGHNDLFVKRVINWEPLK